MHIPWPLIDRYYAGDATPDEQRQVAEYFARFPDRARIAETVATTITEARPSAPHEQDITRMLDTARQRMAVPRAAVTHFVHTYFGGSIRQAMTALLDVADMELTEAEITELREAIELAKEEGR